MELKTFFVQDIAGNILPGATCYLYQVGTSSLVSPIFDKVGIQIPNPFNANPDGMIQFAVANGRYDLRCVAGERDFRMEVQFIDAVQALGRLLAPTDTPPTVRDTGEPLQEGDQYPNTVDHLVYNWNGTEWIPLNESVALLTASLASTTGGTKIGMAQGGDLADSVKTVNFWNFGATGVGDDTAAILAAIAFVKANQGYRLVQHGGTFTYGTPLPFNDPVSVLTNPFGPATFQLDCVMQYSGINKAVNNQGNGFGYKVHIETLVGSGVRDEEGAVGGVEENIGVYIGPNSGVQFSANTVRGFNHNILIDGGYFNEIDVNYSFQAMSAFTTRAHPTLGYSANHNKVRGRVFGGPYAASTADDFPTRRLLTCKYGLKLSGARANFIHVPGIEYSIRDSASMAIDIDETCEMNVIIGHVEGGLRKMIDDRGKDNRLIIDGGNSQSITGNAYELNGIGAEFCFVGEQLVDSQKTLFAPHQGQGGLKIHPTTLIRGTRQHKDCEKNWSVFSYSSRLPAVAAFVRSNAGDTNVVTAADFPPDLGKPGGYTSYTLTTETDSTRWFTVGPHNISADAPADMAFMGYLKGITGQLKVSIFVLNQALEYLGHHNTELSSEDTTWKRIMFHFKTAGATAVSYRIAVRGFVGTAGGSIGLAVPTLSPNISALMNTQGIDGMAGRMSIKGSVLTDATDLLYGFVPNKRAIAVSATSLIVGGRPIVIINSDSGGSAINGFASVTEGQVFKVVNMSGTNKTFSTAATGNGVAFTLVDASAHTPATPCTAEFMQYNGAIYRIG